ncbi:MAG: HAMP domain-containing protein, partial [Candidatus Methanoperedens sp.]|nr:HAMP domain-containing protein [Candidatus Methanoperedens sp.]
IILSFVMASMLTKPLKVLTDTANRVSKGNIHEKVSISSKDEIGDLAESFKRMINAFKIMEALSKEK